VWRVGRLVAARPTVAAPVLVSVAAGEREEQQPAAGREGDEVQHRQQDHKLGVIAHWVLLSRRGSR
jgi:hypothetical protein